MLETTSQRRYSMCILHGVQHTKLDHIFFRYREAWINLSVGLTSQLLYENISNKPLTLCHSRNKKTGEAPSDGYLSEPAGTRRCSESWNVRICEVWQHYNVSPRIWCKLYMEWAAALMYLNMAHLPKRASPTSLPLTWKHPKRWSSCSAEKSQASFTSMSWIFFTMISCFPSWAAQMRSRSFKLNT